MAVESVWHQHMLGELAAVSRVLREAHIPVLALKGPLLGERFYPFPDMRTGLDLDLMVVPELLPSAVAALMQNGYRGRGEAATAQLLKTHHHLGMSREGGPPIELHFRFGTAMGVDMTAADLLERAVAHRMRSGAEVLVLCPEDELVLLSVHAVGHSFASWVWLYDIDRLLVANPDLDWQAVATRAAAWRVTAGLSYTLRLVNDVFGTPVPRTVTTTSPSLWQKLARHLQPAVSATAVPGFPERAGRLLFRTLLSHNLVQSAWLVQHNAREHLRRKRAQRESVSEA